MELSLPNSRVDTTTTPALETIIQTLREVDGRRSRRCYALVGGNADHRCENSYKPRTKRIEDVIQNVRNSQPPFENAFSTRLAHILLCDAHRKEKEHVNPLVRELTADVSASTESRDDISLRKDSLHPLQAEPRPRKRSKSAGPQLEPSHLSPKTGPMRFSDAKMQLLHKGSKFQCISFDGVAERCTCELDQTELTWAGNFLRYVFEEEDCEEAEYEEDDDYEENDGYEEEDGSEEEQEEQRGVPLLLIHLRGVIRPLLCEHHSHWFWLNLYHDLWKKEITCDNQVDNDFGEWSSTEFDSTVAAEESSDEEESLGPEPGSTTNITFNVAMQTNYVQQNYYFASAKPETQYGSAWRTSPTSPGSHITPHGAHYTQYSSHLAPVPTLHPLPEAQGPSLSELLHRSAAANRAPGLAPAISISRAPSPGSLSRSSQVISRRSPRAQSSPRPSSPSPATALDALVAGVNRLDISDKLDHQHQSHTKPAGRPNGGAGKLNSASDVLETRFVRKLEASLANELTKKLTKKDHRRHIYVLTSTRFPGLVKIGIAEDPEGRFEEIERLCGLPGLSMEHLAQDVPYAGRVEKMIHRHLGPMNWRWVCEAEGKPHKEWFRCEVGFAVGVVDAWAGWMRRGPYAFDVLREVWSARVKNELKRDEKFQGEETFVDMFERHRRWIQQS